MGSAHGGKPAGRRAAARAAAAVLAFCAAGAVASGEQGTKDARASLDFRIVVPVILRVEALREPRALAVTPGDVARGYVDVDDGTSLVLTSNNRAGFGVSIAADPAIVSRVVARLEGRSLEADAPAATVHVEAPRLLQEPIAVRYRLFLAPGLGAGTYGWPVRLAFAPGA
jgi:hypothetical protein